MRFTQATLGLACLISLASAECWKTGVSWDSRENARTKLDGVCDALKGNYRAQGDIFGECRNGLGNQRYNFSVKRTASGGGSLSKDICIARLAAEISCGQGGRRNYGDFEFT